jgi:H+/Cl- antiporter ClcA
VKAIEIRNLRLIVSGLFLASMVAAFTTHFFVANRHSFGLSLSLVKAFSDVVFLGLLGALVGYLVAFFWTLFREKKVAVLFLFYFAVTFVLTVFFAFIWSLETEGFRP